MQNNKDTDKSIKNWTRIPKNSIKKVLKAEKSDVEGLFKQAISTIDRVYSKGIIHKNRASSHKSKLTKYINSL